MDDQKLGSSIHPLPLKKFWKRLVLWKNANIVQLYKAGRKEMLNFLISLWPTATLILKKVWTNPSDKSMQNIENVQNHAICQIKVILGMNNSQFP